MIRAAPLLAAIIVMAAATLFFLPPPAGFTVAMMRAAGLVVLALGLWAFHLLPEHITGLIFMTLAVLFAVAPPHVVFSGFASATMWLVFGGLFIAEAVRATGLGERLARLLLDRYASSYPAALTGVAVVTTLLTFLMPATIGRVLLVIPIISALASRMGFEPGSRGYNGLLLCAITTTYHSGTGVLPANAPNLVLAGAAETLYGLQIIYAEYFLVQFPVMGLLKLVVSIGVLLLFFPAQPRPAPVAAPLAPMTASERRLSIILLAAILFWATDFLHHIKAGWIALVAAIACMMPRIGVIPLSAFNERVRYGPFFYVASILGLGGVMTEAGLTKAIGDMFIGALDVSRGADAANFATLVGMSTLTGLVTTNPAQPALLAPLAAHFAEATGWPLKAVLMTMAIGYSTMLLPYMVPPMVVGFQVAGIGFRDAMRFVGPTAVVSLTVLVPLDYLWWRVIGYFG
ncbi:MAG: SLC13 family permease [Burkholderiales bacterium]